MEVLFHDLHTGTKSLRRGVYNYGGRHALGLTGRALQYGVGGLAFGTGYVLKGGIEHGLKSAWWLTKGAVWLGARTYNAIDNRMGGRRQIQQLPNMARYNWGTRLPPGIHRALVPLVTDRPAWLNWGQYNPTQWNACPIPPKYIPHKYRPDEFDAYDMYGSLETHSHEWYTNAANELSRKVDQVFNSLLEEYQTPRTDPLGNFVDAQGNVVAAVAHPVTGVMGPPPEALKSPKLYYTLTSNVPNDVNAAHNALLNRATEHVQLEHVHQVELLERRKAEKANKKLMHEVARLHLVEHWLEIWDNFWFKGTYGEESGFLKWFLGLFTDSV